MTNLNIPGLESVGYSSDGHFLNATFYLSSSFENPPSMHRPSYVIWIDADSNNQTGYTGADFAVAVEFHNDTNTWSRIFEEFSVAGKARVIDKDDNYDDFFCKDNNTCYSNPQVGNILHGFPQKNFVKLYLDLSKIGSPSQYNLAFAVYETVRGKPDHSMYYITPWVPVPLPNFNMSLLPNSLSLRPEEEKSILLRINSTTNLSPSIHIVANKSKDLEKLDIHPDMIIMPFAGESQSQISLKISKDAKEKTVLLPISLVIGLENLEKNKSPALVITKKISLSMSILPKLTIWNYFENYLNSLGPVVKEFIALITAIVGIAGSVGVFGWKILMKIRKKKSKNHQKDKHQPKHSNY
jgi:hypothetical protein